MYAQSSVGPRPGIDAFLIVISPFSTEYMFLDFMRLNYIYCNGVLMEIRSIWHLFCITAGFIFAVSCGGPPTPQPLLGSPEETGLVVVDCRVRIVGNPSSGFSLSNILAAIFLPEKKNEADVSSAYLGILDDSASVYEPDPYE